jgi:parvulin-like peptidyl-prolyl isomerase
VPTLAIVLAVLAAISAAATTAAPSARADAATARPAASEVARVNGVSLMSDRVDVAFNALVPQESFHRSVSAERKAELRQKALQSLIDEELEYQDGVAHQVRITSSEVDAGVAKAARRFSSREAFHEALRRAGATMADARREVRRTLTIQKAQQRAVTMKCQVGRTEAQRFFTEHPDRFVVPEQVRVLAITLGVDPSGGRQQWDEARTRAEDVLRQVKAGGVFEDLARKYSTDSSRASGGDMGLVHRGSLREEFEQATRDLKPGQVSGIVQTIYGYHIVKLGETRPPARRTFAEAGAELRKNLTATRCTDLQSTWLASLRATARIEMAGSTADARVAPRAPGR